jgi:carbon monoxide dehydrogenase subunit G
MRLRKEIEVARPLAEAFAYVADFSNAAEWDPGITKASKLTPGPVQEGSEFDIVAIFRGKEQRFLYVVSALDDNRRVLLTGDGERAQSVDEITFSEAGAGTSIVYVADIRLKGIFRLGEPLVRPTMHKMGDAALAGLKSVLDRSG